MVKICFVENPLCFDTGEDTHFLLSGCYCEERNTILIRKGMRLSNTIRALVHEIGHAVIASVFKKNTSCVQYWWEITWVVFGNGKRVPEWKMRDAFTHYFKSYLDRLLVGDKDAERVVCFRETCSYRQSDANSNYVKKIPVCTKGQDCEFLKRFER
jgi:hypothetical protein